MKGTVALDFKDSRNDALIRASDIIANQAWHHEMVGKLDALEGKLMIVRFP